MWYIIEIVISFFSYNSCVVPSEHNGNRGGSRQRETNRREGRRERTSEGGARGEGAHAGPDILSDQVIVIQWLIEIGQ